MAAWRFALLPCVTGSALPSVHSELIMAEPVPFPYAHVCSVAEHADGSVVAVWQAGQSEDATSSAIWASRRQSDSAWTAPTKAATSTTPSGATECCMNPNLWRAPGGQELFLTFHCGDQQRDGKCSTHSWTAYWSKSTDGGATWTPHVQLPAGQLGSVKNNCRELSNGEVLCPSSVEGRDLLFWTGHFETTDSQFQNWSKTEDIWFQHSDESNKDCQGIIQPTFLESPTQPGRIRALFRSGCGVLATAASDDFGHAWPHSADATSIPNPNAGVDMEDSPAGWLLAFNNNTKHRTPLSLAISTDEGEHWEHLVDLETDPQGSFEYPYLHRSTVDPSIVHLCYTWKQNGSHNMKYSRLQWQTAEQLV